MGSAGEPPARRDNKYMWRRLDVTVYTWLSWWLKKSMVMHWWLLVWKFHMVRSKWWDENLVHHHSWSCRHSRGWGGGSHQIVVCFRFTSHGYQGALGDLRCYYWLLKIVRYCCLFLYRFLVCISAQFDVDPSVCHMYVVILLSRVEVTWKSSFNPLTYVWTVNLW